MRCSIPQRLFYIALHSYGTLLMEEAERIARFEHRSKKLAVISGVGTRHYYRCVCVCVLAFNSCERWEGRCVVSEGKGGTDTLTTDSHLSHFTFRSHTGSSATT